MRQVALRGACLALALALQGLWAQAALAQYEALVQGQAPPEQPAQERDARADAVLRSACAALAGLSTYSFTAETDRAMAWPSGDSVRASQTVTARVARPDRFRVDVEGDDRDQDIVCDGKTLTILDVDSNAYGAVEAGASIDETVRDVVSRYGLNAPLANLLFNEPCAGVDNWQARGRYVGLHMAAGRLCHHLLFIGRDMNWELWIDQADALVRKLVVTDKSLPGWPQYQAVITAWNTSVKLPAKTFVFNPPKGARKIPVLPLEQAQPGN